MAPEVPAHFNFTRDVFERWARERPDGLALWWVAGDGRSEQKFSFAELAAQSRRAAHFFAQLGLQRGDRALLITPRLPQWWISVLGLIRLGVVPIPGTPLLTAKDIRYRLEAADAAALIADAGGAMRAEGLPIRHRILVEGSRPGWKDFAAGLQGADATFDPEPIRSDEPGIIYFTSGTTGPPKMVLHTQASYGLGHRVTGELWLDLKPDDVHWCLTDTGWAKAAWSCLFGPWQMGACVFTTDARGKFEASAALQTLGRYPITTWCAPPTALRLIVREDLSAYRFPQLRHCVSAGEPLNPEVITAWQNATGHTMYEGYGQTETVVLIGNFRSRGDLVRPGSMGKPSPGFTVAVLDDDLNELGPGCEGEVAVRVRPARPLGLFREYWRDPAENAEIGRAH